MKLNKKLFKIYTATFDDWMGAVPSVLIGIGIGVTFNNPLSGVLFYFLSTISQELYQLRKLKEFKILKKEVKN